MPTVAAQPYDYAFDPGTLALVIIDMQRDFLEPGGFGAALGNDVRRLAPAVPVVAQLLRAFRELGLTVVHTKECHRPDLSDCPPAKRDRGRGALRIGDAGPMGRILDRGRAGQRLRRRAAAAAGRGGHRQAGQGRLLRHAACRRSCRRAASRTCSSPA